MRLEEALPTWHFRERHRTSISSPPPVVLQAIEELTWREVPAFRALMKIRFGRTRLAGDAPLLDWFVDQGFIQIHRTDDEIAWAALQPVGRRPAPALAGFAEAFSRFERAGCVKMALNFRTGDDQPTTETRVLATDTNFTFSVVTFVPHEP